MGGLTLRLVLAVALLLSLTAAAFLGVRWRQAESRVQATREWTQFVVDSLGTTLRLPHPPEGPGGRDSIYWQWVATGAQLQSRRWQQAVGFWIASRGTLLDLSDIEDLRRQGLAEPVRQLRDSLIAHPELIPVSGVHGGKMGFHDLDGIILLTPPYVFASFEDGHIGGSMLLEYEVVPGPRVLWKSLWAAAD